MRALLCLAATWALVAMAVFAGPAQSASAHNYIVDTSPGEGETITTLPEQFSVTTNDSLLEVGAAMQISGPAQDPRYFGDGCIVIDGPAAGMPAQLGAAGEYTIEWRVTSADGHPIDGSFTFEWAPDAASAANLVEGAAAPPQCGEAAPSDDAADTGSDDGGSGDADAGADEQGSPNGVELGWIFGGLAVVVLGAVSAWMLVRRLSAGPPAGPNPADRGPSATDDSADDTPPEGPPAG